MRSGVFESPSGNLSVGVRISPMLLGIYTEGGPSILLEFSTEIHQKLGHDKAYPCFTHISCSTLWKAMIMENPMPSVARILDQNLQRTSGFTGKQPRGLR